MPLGPAIASRSNSRVKALRGSFSGEASKPGDLVGIEGENLITEAIGSIREFETVYVREGSEEVLARLPFDAARVKNWSLLTREVFDTALPTRSPQGIAATFAIPEIVNGSSPVEPGVSLVVVGLQDPGNMGTLLRSAEAFGVRRMLATRDTVNPWNPKAVRASAGSVFRIPVLRGSLKRIGGWLRELGGLTYAAVAASERSIPLTQASLAEPCALMIGNEGSGLPTEALALADAAVWIPCAVESLNAGVAGSVLMFECMRQKMLKQARPQEVTP